VDGRDEHGHDADRMSFPRLLQAHRLRLDADLLEWFRTERGYQTRINAILRAYMNAQNRHHR